MIVTQAYDGTFVITGITYAELEDLISAYDSSLFFSPAEAGEFDSQEAHSDLYDTANPMQPLRKAIADAQLTIGEMQPTRDLRTP